MRSWPRCPSRGSTPATTTPGKSATTGGTRAGSTSGSPRGYTDRGGAVGGHPLLAVRTDSLLAAAVADSQVQELDTLGTNLGRRGDGVAALGVVDDRWAWTLSDACWEPIDCGPDPDDFVFGRILLPEKNDCGCHGDVQGFGLFGLIWVALRRRRENESPPQS